MLFGKLRAWILLSAVVAPSSLLVSNVQAGPIMDFFFGPPTTTYRPVTSYYRQAPTTVRYGGACDPGPCGGTYYANTYTVGACDPCANYVPQACQPAVSRPMATTYPTYPTYQPQPAVRPYPTQPAVRRQGFFERLRANRAARQAARRSNVGYLPSSSYRSQWVRVPVTAYRPAITTDPTTGMQVTAMRPCTTSQWQLRRIPVATNRRPFLSRLFGGWNDQPPTTMPAYGTGCSSCPTSGAVTHAPTTIMQTPATTGGAITTPAPSGTPADQPPSLNQPRAQTKGASSPSGSAVNGKPALPPLPTGRTDGLEITPIPDPDASRRTPKTIAPPLLDPRGKTAAFPVRQAWAAAPITWPTAAARPVNEKSPQKRDEIKWDTGGWTSLHD